MEIGKLRAGGPAPAVSDIYSILRSTEPMYSFQGEKGTQSAETCYPVGQSQLETDQPMPLRGNTRHF